MMYFFKLAFFGMYICIMASLSILIAIKNFYLIEKQKHFRNGCYRVMNKIFIFKTFSNKVQLFWEGHKSFPKKCQNHEEDCANLCGLLRKIELYVLAEIYLFYIDLWVCQRRVEKEQVLKKYKSRKFFKQTNSFIATVISQIRESYIVTIALISMTA